MGRGKHNYAELEAEFIQTDLSVSIRGFAEMKGISAWSAVNAQALKHNWREKRQAFHDAANEKAIQVAGSDLGKKIAAVRVDAIDVIHASILKMGLDLQDREVEDYDPVKGVQYRRTIPGQTVTPSDVTKMINSLLLLTGQSTAITEERKLVGHVDFNQLPPDLTRLIADVARERAAESRPVERPRLPGSRGAGPN